MRTTRPTLRRILIVSVSACAGAAVVLTAVIAYSLLQPLVKRSAFTDMRRELDSASGLYEKLGPDPTGGKSLGGRESFGGRKSFGDRKNLGGEGDSRIVFIPQGAARKDPLGQATQRGETEGELQLGGRDVWFVSQPISTGTLAVVRPARDAGLPPGSFLVFFIAAVAAMIVAAMIARPLARRITQPLNTLASAVRNLASGASVVELSTTSQPKEIAELTEDFSRMAHDLTRAREQQRDFLMSVSHELRTPLTAIRGWGEAISEGATTDAKAAGLVVANESRRLERLVGDLLDLSRLSAGRFDVRLTDASLAEIVTGVGMSLEPVASSASVSLEVDCAGAGFVRTDPERLHQLIVNLVENAIRVTPQSGSVKVVATNETFSVSDTGRGLTPHEVERAFDRFFLFERHRGTSDVGTGLGLAIVSELAALLDASISIQSDPSVGTTFTVALPSQRPND